MQKQIIVAVEEDELKEWFPYGISNRYVITRCSECKHRIEAKASLCCDHFGSLVHGSDFCNYGEEGDPE